LDLSEREFKARGRFALGLTSNGINPAREDVVVEVGKFTAVIPAGSFKQEEGRREKFAFRGIIDGVRLSAWIRASKAGFVFQVEGKGADLTGIVNPVTVGIRVGDDGRSLPVTAEFSRKDEHDEVMNEPEETKNESDQSDLGAILPTREPVR